MGSQRGLPPEPLVADLTLELVLDPLMDNPHVTLEVTSRAVTLLTEGTLVLLMILHAPLVNHFLVSPQVAFLFEILTTDLTAYDESSSKMGLHVIFVLRRLYEVLATDLASVFDRRILSPVFDSDVIIKSRFVGIFSITLTAGKGFALYMPGFVDLA